MARERKGARLTHARSDEDDGEGDDTYAHLMPKPLIELPGGGIRGGSILELSDFAQQLECKLVVEHVPASSFDEEKTPELFEVRGQAAAGTQNAAAATAAGGGDGPLAGATVDQVGGEGAVVAVDDHGVLVLDDDGDGDTANGAPQADEEVVVVDDDDVDGEGEGGGAAGSVELKPTKRARPAQSAAGVMTGSAKRRRQ